MSERYEAELPIGYRSPDPAGKGEVHKRLVFDRRPTGRDLIDTQKRRENRVATQSGLLLALVALSEFGSLGKPPLSVLIDLTDTDRRALQREFNNFLELTRGEREFVRVSPDTARLAFGIEADGTVYDTVRFGRMLTGRDHVELDRAGVGGYERLARELCKQITSVTRAEDGARLPRPLAAADVEAMDAYDLSQLEDAREEWIDSFRG